MIIKVFLLGRSMTTLAGVSAQRIWPRSVFREELVELGFIELVSVNSVSVVAKQRIERGSNFKSWGILAAQ